jgi:hypothetical protein
VGDYDGDRRSDIFWRNAPWEAYSDSLYRESRQKGEYLDPQICSSGACGRTAGGADGACREHGLQHDAAPRSSGATRSRVKTTFCPLNGTTVLGTEGYVRAIADANWHVVGMATSTAPTGPISCGATGALARTTSIS